MAAGRLAINASKSGHKSVPTPGVRPSFVLGSRPDTLRSPAVPRVKPAAASTRQYGKTSPSAPGPQLAGAGDTGQTDLS